MFPKLNLPRKGNSTNLKLLNNSTGTFFRQQGLQAHGCFTLERRWGHIDLDTPVAKPKHTLKQLTELVTKAQQNRYPLSINLEMYEDGPVSPESYALLKELKAAVREQAAAGIE